MNNRRRIYRFATWLLLSASATSAQTVATLQPFTIDHRKALLARSPVDVSFLLDAPAGKHGFVRAQGPHLVTGDGKRIRFWGVNVTDWSKGSLMVPSKEDAPLWAASKGQFGCNQHFAGIAHLFGGVRPRTPSGLTTGFDLDLRHFF
jgi:hypothetical protein